MENSFANKLKILRKNFGFTQEKLAKKLHITQTAYGKYEKGINKPATNTLTNLANIFNVSIDYLLDDNAEENGKIQSGIKIPVVGTIPAGIPIEAIEEIIDYEEIPKEWTKYNEYFGLKVKGNSMEPRICSGDVVIIRKQETADSGDVCAVMVNGFDATLKQIKKEPTGIWLIPFNKDEYSPVFYSNEQIQTLPIKILGKVIELRGKFN